MQPNMAIAKLHAKPTMITWRSFAGGFEKSMVLRSGRTFSWLKIGPWQQRSCISMLHAFLQWLNSGRSCYYCLVNTIFPVFSCQTRSNWRRHPATKRRDAAMRSLLKTYWQRKSVDLKIGFAERWMEGLNLAILPRSKSFRKPIFRNLVGCNDLRPWWAWRLWNHFHHGLPKPCAACAAEKTEISMCLFATRACLLFWGVMETVWGLRYPKKTPEEWGELYLSEQIYNDQTAVVTLNGGLGTESPPKSPSIPVLLGQLATSEV